MRITQQNPLIWLLLLFSISACLISSTAIGSSLVAGGNLALIASNSNSNSNNPNDPSKGNLTITGSTLSAGNNTLLHADNSLTLQSAQNTSTLESSNKSSGSSIGIGFAIGGSQNGFTLDASVNRASGRANGTDTSQLNTQVTAANNISLSSGTDTNLKGATVSAHSINANIGGDLNIVSQQDSSQYTSKQTSSGLGVSLCLPPYCYGSSSASGSYGKSKINGDFGSVIEQSGIKAGDGGFAINVGGNTDLKGAIIASTQKAIDDGNNSLTTGSLTQSDLQNQDSYHANGFAVSASVSSKVGDQTNAGNNSHLSDAANQRNASAANSKDTPGASAGIGSQSGSQSSTTLSGISAGNITITNDAKQNQLTGKDSKATIAGLTTGITTDSNTTGALTKAWNSQQLQKQVDAQISITQTFSQIAPKAVADYASQQAASLQAQAKQAEQENDPSKAAALQAEAKKWGEGGTYRIALHTVTGALTGGLTGAAGAGAAASAAPLLDSLQAAAEQALTQQGLGSSTVKAIAQGLAEATALGLGAAVGGSSAAVSALVVDTNNRQLHPDEAKLIRDNASKYAALKGISVEQAKTELTEQALRQIDSAWAARTTDNQAASNFLQDISKTATATQNLGGGTLFDARGTASYLDHTINIKALPQTADLYNQLNSTNLKGITPNVRGTYIAINDAAADPHIADKSTGIYKDILIVNKQLQYQAQSAEESLASNAARLSVATIGANQGGIKPGTDTGKLLLTATGEALVTGLPSDGGNPIGPKVGIGANPGGNVLGATSSEHVPVPGPMMVIEESKFNYFFGKAAPDAHNTPRSLQNQEQLASVGIYDNQVGHELIQNSLSKAVADPSSVTDTFDKNINGVIQHFESRDSLLIGPTGVKKIEVTFEVMPDGSRRVTTIIIKGHK